MKYLLFCLGLIVSTSAVCQLATNYTNSYFYRTILNPAFAGLEKQFMVDDVTQLPAIGFGNNGPIWNTTLDASFRIEGIRSGVGAYHVYDNVGIVSSNVAGVNYAYHQPIGEGKLSFGAQTEFRHTTVMANWTSIDGTHDDPAIPSNDLSVQALTFTGGLVYDAPGGFIGLSYRRAGEVVMNQSHENIPWGAMPQIYVHGGLKMELGDALKFNPDFMLIKNDYFSSLRLNWEFELQNFVFGYTSQLGFGILSAGGFVGWNFNEEFQMVLGASKSVLGYMDYPNASLMMKYRLD